MLKSPYYARTDNTLTFDDLMRILQLCSAVIVDNELTDDIKLTRDLHSVEIKHKNSNIYLVDRKEQHIRVEDSVIWVERKESTIKIIPLVQMRL